MRPDDLHAYITLLEQADELVRIDVPVDPRLELATIADRVSKGAGRRRALLFDAVKGAGLPVAVNLFGTRQRVAWALGTTDLEGLANRVAEALRQTGEVDSSAALARLTCDPRWQAQTVFDADCFAIERPERLHALPSILAWPGDGGCYLTLGQVFSRAPESHQQNCGMYRLQILAAERGALRLHPGSGCARHLDAWADHGQPMPVAITLGGPPALTWAAGVSLPDTVCETDYVGFLTGKPVSMVPCRTLDLNVPAQSEIVIEGYIHPGEQEIEGPFGNHTGGYVAAAPAPVFRVDKVYHRSHAVFPWTLVGPPPMEDLALAAATERLLLPMLRHDHPWVLDVHMPREGIFHRAALVRLGATAPVALEEVLAAIDASLLLRRSRILVLLDETADLGQPAQVYWKVVNAIDGSERLQVTPRQVVIDARTASGSKVVHPDPQVLSRVLARWSDYRLDP